MPPKVRVITSDVLVLCTRHRPDEVRVCLETVRNQTRVPDRVLVVDSSDDDETVGVVADSATRWTEGSVIEHRRAERGLTLQRAAGIDSSTEEIVHVIDDDTLLEPVYFEGTVRAFVDAAAGALGGVGGFVTDQPAHNFRRLDAWLGLDAASDGVVLRSGSNVRVYSEPVQPIAVDWLSGCAMSYRRAVFATERPNLELPGAGDGEGVEFSYRVRWH